jgi:hypothetical protein
MMMMMTMVRMNGYKIVCLFDILYCYYDDDDDDDQQQQQQKRQ